MMSPKPAEAMRRLQIAAIGLIAVIMVGSITRMIVGRADVEEPVEEIDVVTGEPLPAPEPIKEKPAGNVDEPLAELGVQPMVEKPADQQQTEQTDAP